MKFTLYFANFATGELVAAHRTAMTARHAENNFRRFMRATGSLSKGDSYSLVTYTDWRDITKFPDSLWEAPRNMAH